MGTVGSLFHKPGTEKQAMQELHAVVEQWAQKFNEGNAEAIATLFAGFHDMGNAGARVDNVR